MHSKPFILHFWVLSYLATLGRARCRDPAESSISVLFLAQGLLFYWEVCRLKVAEWLPPRITGMLKILSWWGGKKDVWMRSFICRWNLLDAAGGDSNILEGTLNTLLHGRLWKLTMAVTTNSTEAECQQTEQEKSMIRSTAELTVSKRIQMIFYVQLHLLCPFRSEGSLTWHLLG